MPKERILITVKTYPTLSDKYQELACTAGFREDGSWVRLYPIPFRLLEENKRYKKYQWIEVEIAKNKGDPRPESFNVINVDEIQLLNVVGTGRNRDWAERKSLILSRNKIYTDLEKLIEHAHNDELSLAIFKPTSVDNFKIDKAPSDWPEEKLKKILESMKQAHLFEDKQDATEFRIMPKLPFKFSYRFKDENGKASTLMIEDWEIGQLYWNCLREHGEADAVKKVEEKYMDEFVGQKDLYLFLGTTREWHIRRAPNPFVIIGTFVPPIERQIELL